MYIILNGTALVQKHGEQITIESLYLSETTTSTMGVRLCHKLTRDHVWLTSHNRMRVYLAAQVRVIASLCTVYGLYHSFTMTQVMSESVASGLEYMNRDGTEQTRLINSLTI